MNNNQNKKKGRWKFFLLFLLGVGITVGSIYLYKENEKKSQSFIPIAADLYSSDKIYKAGKPYYQAVYSYVVKDKMYKYKYPDLTENSPEEVIVVKYNKKNPNNTYNKDINRYCIIAGIVGIAISVASIIIIIAKSTTIPAKNVTATVVDLVTCVGGSRIYLSDTQIPDNDNRARLEKYYVLFSNDLEKYKIGNKITFDVNKYGEFLSTEKYKDNLIARSLNDFKNEDLILIKEENGKLNI